MEFEVRPSRPHPLQCLRCGRCGHITAAYRRPEWRLRCGGRHGKDANCTSKVRCLHGGRAHSADSADWQLWQRERRLAPIKASAPTYLPHGEAQAALRASPSGNGWTSTKADHTQELRCSDGRSIEGSSHLEPSAPVRRARAGATCWYQAAGLCQASPTHEGFMRTRKRQTSGSC
ncbi:hypothetical protein MTO96_048713 [Rhipicephalus appendiculatus]